jgi:chromosome segregation ATPase
MSNVKITALEIENVKRVRAVSVDTTSPLTVIGGKNSQGKTSVLDAVMWTLGGDKFRPSNPVRKGEEQAYTKITLDNGVVVERKGVNGSLKVTSPTGKGGQSLLNEFVSSFALDLPKFMASTGIEKAKLLLEVFPGLGRELQRLNEETKRLYNERLAIGQIADRKAKYAKELPYIEGVPETPLSGADMAEKMKTALSVNARNDELRRNVGKIEEQIRGDEYRLESIGKRVSDLKRQLIEAEKEFDDKKDYIVAAKAALNNAKAESAGLQNSDTSEIEKELEQIDQINANVRANSEKAHAEAESDELKKQYNSITESLEKVRSDRLKLLSSVKMPLEGLLVDEEGELVFAGQRWDCMSGSEQLRVATAICAAIKPACGFVLLDKLECMDTETLSEFGAWLASRDLQAIGTRVGTGSENSIIIEDGVVAVDESAVKF